MTTPDYHINLGRRVPKNPEIEGDFGYQPVVGSAFYKPTILILGGNDDNYHVNGYGKAIQMLLTGDSTIFPKDVQIVCGQYSEDFTKNYKFNNMLKRTAEEDLFCDEAVKSVVIQQFLPIIAKNISMHDDIIASSEKLPIDALKRNLRNINIVSHSYGGVIAQQIANGLQNYMQKIGYDDDEIKQAMAQVSWLNLGGVNSVKQSNKPQFTALHVINSKDDIVIERNDNIYLAKQILGEQEEGLAVLDNKQQAIMLQNPRKIVSVQSIDGIDEANIIKKDIHPHELKPHLNYRTYSNDEAVPSAAGNFLGNAINNSVRNNRRSDGDFVELSDLQNMTEHLPHQSRHLQNRFEKAISR